MTTYPAILTMRRHKAEDNHSIRFWKLDALPEGNFAAAFAAGAETFPQGKQGEENWEIENPALRKLRDKIVHGKKKLKEVYGSPLYGIKIGLNEAFVVNRATRDRLIAEDPKSAKLLVPWLEGKDLIPTVRRLDLSHPPTRHPGESRDPARNQEKHWRLAC